MTGWTSATRPNVISPGRGGAKQKLATQFVKDLHAHWLENGPAAIRVAYHEDPIAYLKIVASVIPRDLIISDGGAVEQLDDTELEALITRARQQLLAAPQEARLVGEQKVEECLELKVNPVNPARS